jgi:predicted nuclease of predicted toxin-antitoxin system
MRFLIDNALGPQLAAELQRAGHDALHVRDVGLRDAADETILKFAASEGRIVVSADTDFGTLLATSGGVRPSFILFRRGSPRRPQDQAVHPIANLPNFAEDLERGAIVTFLGGRLRVRALPLRSE